MLKHNIIHSYFHILINKTASCVGKTGTSLCTSLCIQFQWRIHCTFLCSDSLIKICMHDIIIELINCEFKIPKIIQYMKNF